LKYALIESTLANLQKYITWSKNIWDGQEKVDQGLNRFWNTPKKIEILIKFKYFENYSIIKLLRVL
jgi:hypothetical protein